MRRPLDGVTVVALEQVIAGPFCTRQLAELGARVIKIERPEGGDQSRSMDRTVQGLSSHFVWTNRSKESLALDVKHPRARAILTKLLARADVFVQNLAPGAVERLGLGAAELRARHPRLVWCGISGYGTSGPYAEKRAYDDMQKKLTESGFQITALDGKGHAARIAREVPMFKEIIDKAGLKIP